jgi:hypothetical protein
MISVDKVTGESRNRLRGAEIFVAVMIVACSVFARAAAKEVTVDELKARLAAANVADRPQICLQIAERQLAAADKFYTAVESEKAQAALADVVAFSEQARDYCIQSHKHQKQTEIAARKMARKLADIKHTVTLDEQAAVQNAIDRLDKVRDDLLFAMFPKKGDR